MKITVEQFKCDNSKCENRADIDKGTGYPYEKGWLYLYNFQMKSRKDKELRKTDSHFCSTTCFIQFLTGVIEGTVPISSMPQPLTPVQNIIKDIPFYAKKFQTMGQVYDHGNEVSAKTACEECHKSDVMLTRHHIMGRWLVKMIFEHFGKTYTPAEGNKFRIKYGLMKLCKNCHHHRERQLSGAIKKYEDISAYFGLEGIKL